MASIFKRNNRKNEPYTIQYRNHLGKRVTKKGFTDKGLTEQLAAQLESEARLRVTGMVDVDQERFAEHKRAAIGIHVAAFKESLLDNSPLHVSVTVGRVERIVAGCGFKTLADIDTEAVVRFLRKLRKEEDIARRTYNHYIQALDAFCRWCVQNKRLLSNPLLGIERLNVEIDIRRKRRALTAEEVARMIQAARASSVIVERQNGEKRARIYIFSYMTGLRRKEMGSLTPRSFDLDSKQPTVTVEAACSKHRRKDVLPLHPELVVMLRDWLKDLTPGQNLFSGLERRRTARMVRKDLKAAGIPFETDDGIADFHAAGRHTHITELLRNGVSIPAAKELARHSDVNQTMRYTHIGLTDQAKAVAQLPAAGLRPPAEHANDNQPALHGRCISGGFDCPDASSADAGRNVANDEKHCDSRGLDAECRSVSRSGKLGPLGLEPRTNRL
jgi:integrase